MKRNPPVFLTAADTLPGTRDVFYAGFGCAVKSLESSADLATLRAEAVFTGYKVPRQHRADLYRELIDLLCPRRQRSFHIRVLQALAACAASADLPIIRARFYEGGV